MRGYPLLSSSFAKNLLPALCILTDAAGRSWDLLAMSAAILSSALQRAPRFAHDPCSTPLHAKPLRRQRSINTFTHERGSPAQHLIEPITARSSSEIVDEVLDRIKGTDNGIDVPDATRSKVDGLLDQLEREGASQQPRPLQDPLLYGNYNVAYTSSARSSDRGQRERSALQLLPHCRACPQ